MKKFLRKLIFLSIILIILSGSITFLIGFGYYSRTLHNKSLSERVDVVTSKEHFTPYKELSQDYTNAVVAVEDHRFYEHGALDFIAIARAV